MVREAGCGLSSVGVAARAVIGYDRVLGCRLRPGKDLLVRMAEVLALGYVLDPAKTTRTYPRLRMGWCAVVSLSLHLVALALFLSSRSSHY